MLYDTFDLVLGGGSIIISIGTIVAILKLAFMLWKRRQELKELIKNLGMSFTTATKKYIKRMTKILKDWIKLMDWRLGANKKEIVAALRIKFLSLINDPNAEKATAEFISQVNEIWSIFKEAINKLTNGD